MGSRANGVNCGVVEWVKRNMLRWYGYIEKMGSEEFLKKVYMRESVGGPSSRGRPHERWRERVIEYMCERGLTRGRLDQARRECLVRERWRLFCHGCSCVGRSRRERGVRAIDR